MGDSSPQVSARGADGGEADIMAALDRELADTQAEIRNATQQNVANDLLTQFANAIAQRYPVTINQEIVDQLLASPRYGEKWARHWLDVARYSDTNGYEKDLRREQWAWRDWVIDALNTDMPYNEFIRLQIAGDVLDPHDPRAVIATGFFVAGPYDEVGQSQQSEAMKAVVRQDEMPVLRR